MKHINTYRRGELERLVPLARKSKGPFTEVEILRELDRRDDILRKQADREKYPQLSHA